MKVIIYKSFNNDVKKIKDKKLLQQIIEIISQVESATSQNEIQNLKKLKGYKQFYRIRTGNYRIGISITNTTVSFARFLHRKDIYKYFPAD
jgi:mRNA interferase RelE/StbE